MINDDTAGALSLEPNGETFVLRRVGPKGEPAEIELSAMDVLTLAQMSITLKQQLLAHQNPTGSAISAVVATDVARISLNTDALKERVLLSLIAPGGSQAIYAFPRLQAQLLADNLPRHIARLNSTNRTDAQ